MIGFPETYSILVGYWNYLTNVARPNAHELDKETFQNLVAEQQTTVMPASSAEKPREYHENEEGIERSLAELRRILDEQKLKKA